MHLFVDNLCNIDFSYFCQQRGLVGETWLASIEIEGALDEQGMVCDFGVVKKAIRAWLETHLDHCLLVPESHASMSIMNDGQYVKACMADGTECIAPAEAITVIPVSEIGPSTVALWAEEKLLTLFSTELATQLLSLQLRFEPEQIDGSYYHYSHGLKKHRGACQRIAHGHRSQLKIWRNGQLCQQSIDKWCQRFKDIYIATREDLESESDTHYHFSYQAQQGRFFLSVKKALCYFIDTDSTVEYIAKHVFDTLRQGHPDDTWAVKAYEGIGKGATVK